MANEPSKQNSSLKSLFLLITAGVGSAFLLTLGLILAFGPSGSYQIKKALIAPDLITSLAYDDTNRKTGGDSRFIFEGLVLSFPDEKTGQRQIESIDPERYAQLYALIANDQSMETPTAEIMRLFDSPKSASLAIQVRTESHAPWQDETKAFEELKFVGDYYSLKLHEESPTSSWIYFKHPGIYKRALQILQK